MTKLLCKLIFLLAIMLTFLAWGCRGTDTEPTASPAAPLPPDEAYCLSFSQDIAYVGHSLKGFQIFDISQPDNPRLISELALTGDPMDIAIRDNYALVASGYYGLQIIDIRQQDKPSLAGSYQPGSSNAYTSSLGLLPDMVMMATGMEGLVFVDIENPLKPKPAHTLSPPADGAITSVTLKDQYAFIADDRSGLIIADISDPHRPQLLSVTKTPGTVEDIALDETGQMAFIADYRAGLLLLDISDLSHPRILGNYDGMDLAVAVAYSQDKAWVADYKQGLVVIDISDPQNPRRDHAEDTGKTNDIKIYNGYAFCACQEGLLSFSLN